MTSVKTAAAKLDPEALGQHSDAAARLLKALANAQRLRVLCLLSEGELNVGQINRQLPELSQSALSQHLARLREDGLVTTRRESQTIWYSLPAGPAGKVIETLYHIYCGRPAKVARGKATAGRAVIVGARRSRRPARAAPAHRADP